MWRGAREDLLARENGLQLGRRPRRTSDSSRVQPLRLEVRRSRFLGAGWWPRPPPSTVLQQAHKSQTLSGSLNMSKAHVHISLTVSTEQAGRSAHPAAPAAIQLELTLTLHDTEMALRGSLEILVLRAQGLRDVQVTAGGLPSKRMRAWGTWCQRPTQLQPVLRT